MNINLLQEFVLVIGFALIFACPIICFLFGNFPSETTDNIDIKPIKKYRVEKMPQKLVRTNSSFKKDDLS